MRLSILILLLVLTTCNSTNYQLSEEIFDNPKEELEKKLLNTSLFHHKGELKGIYIEKGKSYYFETHYNLKNHYLNLKFFTPLERELVFEADLKNGESSYLFFTSSFFSVKIGLILDQFHYLLKTMPDRFDLHRSMDDYWILIDEDKNYYKYDDTVIVKKENNQYRIKYQYENTKLSLIEIFVLNKKYYIKLEF